jgi:hypothetical protein
VRRNVAGVSAAARLFGVAPASEAELAQELRRLRRAIAYWSPARWQVQVGNTTRSDVVFDLVLRLSALAAEAGGQPPEAVPPRIGDHALADQLSVVGAALLAASPSAATTASALASVAETRALLRL